MDGTAWFIVWNGLLVVLFGAIYLGEWMSRRRRFRK